MSKYWKERAKDKFQNTDIGSHLAIQLGTNWEIGFVAILFTKGAILSGDSTAMNLPVFRDACRYLLTSREYREILLST